MEHTNFEGGDLPDVEKNPGIDLHVHVHVYKKDDNHHAG